MDAASLDPTLSLLGKLAETGEVSTSQMSKARGVYCGRADGRRAAMGVELRLSCQCLSKCHWSGASTVYSTPPTHTAAYQPRALLPAVLQGVSTWRDCLPDIVLDSPAPGCLPWPTDQ